MMRWLGLSSVSVSGSRLPRVPWALVVGLVACVPTEPGNEPEATTSGATTTGGPSPADTTSEPGGSTEHGSTGSTSEGTTSEGSTEHGSTGSTSEGSTEHGSTGTASESSTGSTSESSTGSTSEGSTGAGPVCGNGIVEDGEDCDGVALSATCEDLGFFGGTLACSGACVHDASGCADLPGVPVLVLDPSAIKQLEFTWAAVAGADTYQLEESAGPGEPFVQLGGDIVGTSIALIVPLHLRHQASYRLRACNVVGCTDSAVVDVVGSLAEAVGYVKASNTGVSDAFGRHVALSGDGNTLAVGAWLEDSNATGIGGNQANDAASGAGAVYVFVRDAMGAWSQQAYVKGSNTTSGDGFGYGVSLSDDGNTLAVGAFGEDSSATGVGGNQADDSASASGAVYVFDRDGAGSWSQQAYVKASNTGAGDSFCWSLMLSGDGNTLAVSAPYESSNATGIDGNQANESNAGSGAVYVFVRGGMGAWSQQAYVKASNTGTGDNFGYTLALSDDGSTLAVGAPNEDSNATGIGGNQASNALVNPGAAYVFVRDGLGAWSQQAYVKASNTGASDLFGWSMTLSGDGDTLAVGAPNEDSSATGIGGNEADGATPDAGAVYVLVRDGLGAWSQQAYVKASNTGSVSDLFGSHLALSSNGDTLAVAAHNEDGDAIGIGGNEANDAMADAGAVYVLVRDGMDTWTQRAYVKASNTGPSDAFGARLALAGDGNTLAIGAYNEDSSATGIGGDQGSEAAAGAGAVYLY